MSIEKSIEKINAIEEQVAATTYAAFVDDAAQIAPLIRLWLRDLNHLHLQSVLVIAGPQSPLVGITATARRPLQIVLETPHALALVSKPFSLTRFEQALSQHLNNRPSSDQPWGLIIDMDWLLLSPAASANASVWGSCAERLAQHIGPVLAIYHRRHTPERLLLAGLYAHRHVVSLGGCHHNPYWLPDAIASGSSAKQRLDHWLNQLHPAFTAHHPALSPTAGFAQGSSLRLREPDFHPTDDDPLPSSPPILATANDNIRWKIRCFGQLRVYLAEGIKIQWDGAAGAARKARALFAFLLLRGNRGATAEELIEWLWPDAATHKRATNRLHHTINGLRRSLLPPSSISFDPPRKGRQHPYLVLEEGRYRLRPPPNTWVDVEDFEQLCRQGASLLREGALNEALLCLETALNLYSGDLFEDLPSELTESQDHDWCWSKRYWFREMVFKVHRDCATVHRLQGQYLQAIHHCQQALKRDPACELAHGELMRIYAAQGRSDALNRQYRLYRHAATANHAPESIRTALASMTQLHADLTASLNKA